MYDLRTHPEADAELEDQLAYLAERTLWQAGRFADRYRESLIRLRKYRTLDPFVWREFSRYNVPDSSHSIIYRVSKNEVFIIALMHEKRHPDYWKHRIADDQG